MFPVCLHALPEPTSALSVSGLWPAQLSNTTIIAAGPWPVDEKVRSDINLSLAMRWLSGIPRADLQAWMAHLAITEHRCAYPSQEVGLNGVMFPVQICQKTRCERCESKRGGFAFKHQGPWAPSWLVCPDHMEPKVHYQACLRIMSNPALADRYCPGGTWAF